MVRDQEDGGSNPLAPTNPLESVNYIAQKSYERLVVIQDAGDSNPLALDHLSPVE